MDRGEAESFLLRSGYAVRRIRRLPFADLAILPTGLGIALIPAELQGRDEEEAFEALLWRCWLMRFGHAAMRRQMNAWLHGDPAA